MNSLSYDCLENIRFRLYFTNAHHDHSYSHMILYVLDCFDEPQICAYICILFHSFTRRQCRTTKSFLMKIQDLTIWQSIPWQLMPLLLVLPGNQQPIDIGKPKRGNFKYINYFSAAQWNKMQTQFYMYIIVVRFWRFLLWWFDCRYGQCLSRMFVIPYRVGLMTTSAH